MLLSFTNVTSVLINFVLILENGFRITMWTRIELIEVVYNVFLLLTSVYQSNKAKYYNILLVGLCHAIQYKTIQCKGVKWLKMLKKLNVLLMQWL